MTLTELQEKFNQRTARLGVIGLGYVGLPVASLFAEAGFDVLGLDLKAERVAQINQGISPIEGDEPGLAELVAQVTASGHLRATTEAAALQDRDVVILCVQTPVDENHAPRYVALRSALRSLGTVLSAGTLVIVESTIAPGTMNGVVQPLLEESSGLRVNDDFYLGHCPERVMPGKLLANLRTVSRVCGGATPETAQTMIALYRTIVQADLDPADCVTAELVKTAENAYRDVNIAFANEVALICEQVGGDVWKVRELVNKSPGRRMLYPGAGVGGHCIPKDPWLLAYEASKRGTPIRLIAASRAVNTAMPQHIAALLADALREVSLTPAQARVLILGYAYLENSDDTRNSPSAALVEQLHAQGTQVVIHDPYVAEYKGDLLTKAQNCDAVILMVAHQAYRELDLAAVQAALNHPVLVDGRNVYAPEQLASQGWIYRSIGRGVRR